MYEISCEMCMDLMPLVNDGVASADSRAAVENHIRSCEACRGFCEEEQAPQVSEQKAVSRIVRKIQMFVLLFVVGTVLVVAFLVEQIMRGAAAIFVLLMFFGGWFLRYIYGKVRQTSNVGLRILAFSAGVGLILGAGVLINTILGNPISHMLARDAVSEYLAEQYPGTDFHAEDVTFNFKTGEYYAEIRSESSVDSHFELQIDMMGNVCYDDYAECVANGMNTANRIEKAYRSLVDPVLKMLNLSYNLHIGYGKIIGVELEMDKEYDLYELGARAGHLTVYIRDDVVTEDRAAQILLEIKEMLDGKGIGFRTIDFSLSYPRTEYGGQTQEGKVEVRDFLYEDIYEEGMEERVRAANEAAIAYHAEQDAKK